MENKEKPIYLIEIVMMVIAFFAIILQIFPPKTIKDQITNVLYFFGIIIFILLTYVIRKISRKVEQYIVKINKNEAEIEKMKEEINTEKKFHKLESQLLLIEQKLKGRKNEKQR